MTDVRRLHHVAVVVENTERALEYFVGKLSFQVVHSETSPDTAVRLTYLDLGNAYLQIVEPLHPDTPIAEHLRDHGEGFHHICFAVDEPVRTAAGYAGPSAGAPTVGSGMGRVSAFVPGQIHHGVRIECTESTEGPGPGSNHFYSP